MEALCTVRRLPYLLTASNGLQDHGFALLGAFVQPSERTGLVAIAADQVLVILSHDDQF